MSSIIKYDSVRKLQEATAEYQSIVRIGDASNILDLSLTFVKKRQTESSPARNDFEELFKVFSGKKGSLSTGQDINMSQIFTEDYFKFKSNIILPEVKSKVENYVSVIKPVTKTVAGPIVNGVQTYTTITENVIYSSGPLELLSNVYRREFNSFFLFFNGRKIPDNEIFVHRNPSSTDIFVPIRYIGDYSGDIEINVLIEERFPGMESLYFYSKAFSGNSIVITPSAPEHQYNVDYYRKFVKRTCVMFVDGKIYSDFDSSLKVLPGDTDLPEGSTIVVTPASISNKTVEVYFLADIVFNKNDTTIDTTPNNNLPKKIQIFIDEKYIYDYISGPLSPNAVSVFYNGFKIHDPKIVQTSRYSYEYEHFENTIDYSKLFFFVEDRNVLIDENMMEIYGPDYYLLNMLGIKNCVSRFKQQLTHSIFDNPNYFLDFKKTLSDNHNKFNVSQNINYFKIIRNIRPESSKIKRLLDNNSHLVRTFLSEYGNKSKFSLVRNPPTNVTISSMYPLKKDEQGFHKIFVNSKLLRTSNYTVSRIGDRDFIEIDGSVFTNTVNTLDYTQYHTVQKQRSVYAIPGQSNVPIGGVDIIINKTTLNFGLDVLHQNICVLRRIDNEVGYTYATPSRIGYIPVAHTLTDSGSFFTLHVTEDFPHGIILCDVKFSFEIEIIVDDTDGSYMTDQDIVIPLYQMSGTVPIPMINATSPEFYINGRELILGRDYTYVTPFDKPDLACSAIILRTRYNNGDLFTVLFTNMESTVLLNYDRLNIDNLYGLLYLRELPYPFSTDYLNITVNGSKLSEFHIDILSDKLIRIKGITRPIRSVLITTKFTEKYTDLEEYVSRYTLTDFELLMERIFYNCDPSKEKSSSYPDIDTVYDGFHITVDSINKQENPLEAVDGNQTEVDLLQVLYVKWLCLSGRARSYMFNEQSINNRVLRYFSMFVNEVIGNRLDIPIDCNRKYLGFTRDVVGDRVLYPKYDYYITNSFFMLILNDMLLHSTNSTMGYSEVEASIGNHKGCNYLYPHDLPMRVPILYEGIRYTGTLNDIVSIYDHTPGAVDPIHSNPLLG